jgi:hypothetical protein
MPGRRVSRSWRTEASRADCDALRLTRRLVLHGFGIFAHLVEAERFAPATAACGWTNPLTSWRLMLFDLYRSKFGDYLPLIKPDTEPELEKMAVAECGIRENLAQYYSQKSAPARL